MDLFSFDFASLFTPAVLLAILAGTTAGMLIGALPGLGAVLAMVLLLPVTYTMEPLPAVLMLLATYQAAEYGGSISAVVLGIPGTPAALVTVFDGNTLARNGSPGKALAYSLFSSSIGGMFSGILLITLSVPLVAFALQISDPEFFLIALIGLLAVGALSSQDISKSYISVILGLMAGTVGLDTVTGQDRFTFGRPELFEGVGLVALLAGMFGISELIMLISQHLGEKYATSKDSLKTKLSWRDFRGVVKPIGLGSVIGAVVGIIPGLGAGPSSWFAYSAAKKTSKSPQTFGQGNPEGIAAPESANNATVGGSLIPLLSLGIPGSPSMAIIMGAFIVQGLQPGPGLFSAEPNLVQGIMYGFLFTSIAMFIVGKFVTSLFVKVLTVSNAIIVPLVLICILVGTYSSRSLFFDLWIALGVGVITVIAIKLKYSVAAFVLAYVLGPIIETSLRRSLLISDGSYAVFVTRPYSLVMVIAIALIIIAVIWKSIRAKRQDTAVAVNAS